MRRRNARTRRSARRARLVGRRPAAQLLLRELRQHDVHGFRPSGQELPGIETGGGVLAEHALLDDDDVEPAPHRRLRRAQPRQATAGDQEIAGQALVRRRRRRKVAHFLVVGRALPHVPNCNSTRAALVAEPDLPN